MSFSEAQTNTLREIERRSHSVKTVYALRVCTTETQDFPTHTPNVVSFVDVDVVDVVVVFVVFVIFLLFLVFRIQIAFMNLGFELISLSLYAADTIRWKKLPTISPSLLKINTNN